MKISLALLLLALKHINPVAARLGESSTGRSLFSGSLFGDLEWLMDSGEEATNFFEKPATADVPKQYIVKFGKRLSLEELERKAFETARQLGGEVKFIYNHVFQGVAIGNVPEYAMKARTNDVSHRIRADDKDDDDDMTIESDHSVVLTTISARSQSSAPRALDRLNQKALPLDGRYDYKYDGSNVTVFVLDTGIRETHTQFENGQVACGYNAIEWEDCTDHSGHGTHVAGSIASRTFGVAKSVKLISVKVLDMQGGGTVAGVLAGIEYVIDQKTGAPNQPMVINMSVGGGQSPALNQAVERAVEAGIVVVVAAGNDDTDACTTSPASANAAITVGASEIRSWLIFFTRDRRAKYSNHGSCLDVFAIGSNVESASIDDDAATSVKSGTSMACPHAAGSAALYLQRDPNMTPAQVKSAMLSDAASEKMLRWFQKGSPNKLLNTKNID